MFRCFVSAFQSISSRSVYPQMDEPFDRTCCFHNVFLLHERCIVVISVSLFFCRAEKARSSCRESAQWRSKQSHGGVSGHRGHQRPEGSGPHCFATAVFPRCFPTLTNLTLLCCNVSALQNKNDVLITKDHSGGVYKCMLDVWQ